jgi:RimJ/RimL family protein N-acetyltransferase
MTVPSQTGRPLSADVLARRAALPVKFAPLTLTGSFVRLEPLDLDRDVEALFAVSNGEPARLGDREIPAYDAEALIWRYMPVGPFADVDAMRAALRAQVNSPNGLCLCVFNQPTGRQVGAVNFLANMPEHLKVELGSIWYSPLVQRTKTSLEATYLMLGHAFALGYRRVEWKCDAFNERSRRSALRMGFQFEGIQDAHYIVKGRNRDTAWFRILDDEWPSVKARLEAMLRV